MKNQFSVFGSQFSARYRFLASLGMTILIVMGWAVAQDKPVVLLIVE
jgi:hypothetical protein